jgi:hypothetical protein
MTQTGQVYKFVGTKGVIRPDSFGQYRRDVLFDKRENDLIIGDRVVYEHMEKNSRRYAFNLKKV